MHKSALGSVALFLRYFQQLERNHNGILASLSSQPIFLINETGKSPPLTVSQWGPFSPVQILVGHCGHFSQLSLASCKWPLFIVCFAVVSLASKDFITADSVFYREKSYRAKMQSFFFASLLATASSSIQSCY